MSTFTHTDDLQWVRHNEGRSFTTIEVTEDPSAEGKLIVQVQDIDLDDYTEEQIIDYISGFGYDSILIVKQRYGDNADQIIAECISECDPLFEKDVALNLTSAQAADYLMSTYGIKAEL